VRVCACVRMCARARVHIIMALMIVHGLSLCERESVRMCVCVRVCPSVSLSLPFCAYVS